MWADDGERKRRYLRALLRGVKCEAGAEWLQPSTAQWVAMWDLLLAEVSVVVDGTGWMGNNGRSSR